MTKHKYSKFHLTIAAFRSQRYTRLGCRPASERAQYLAPTPLQFAVAHYKEYDIALIFSQDQDLSEAVIEVQKIAKDQDRKIWVASAFPVGRNSKNLYGINRSESIAIIEFDYNTCLDKWDYWKSINSKGP